MWDGSCTAQPGKEVSGEMENVCEVLMRTDETTSLHYYKIQEASREVVCVGMNSILCSAFPGFQKCSFNR